MERYWTGYRDIGRRLRTDSFCRFASGDTIASAACAPSLPLDYHHLPGTCQLFTRDLDHYAVQTFSEIVG